MVKKNSPNEFHSKSGLESRSQTGRSPARDTRSPYWIRTATRMHGAFSATAERLLQYTDRQVVHRRNCCRCITVIVSPTLTTLRQVLDHTLPAKQRNNRLQLVKLQAVGSRPRHTNNNLVISCLIFSCLQAMCSWAKNNNNNNNNNFTSFHGPVLMLELSLLLLRWQHPWCHGAKHQSGVCLPMSVLQVSVHFGLLPMPQGGSSFTGLDAILNFTVTPDCRKGRPSGSCC